MSRKVDAIRNFPLSLAEFVGIQTVNKREIHPSLGRRGVVVKRDVPLKGNK